MAILDQNHMLKVSIPTRGAGNPAERAALGGKYYPSANSRTNHRRGTNEAVIESSQHEDSYELLKIFLISSRVRSKSGQRSKARVYGLLAADTGLSTAACSISSNASK